MSYLTSAEFVTKMVDSGASKISMSTRNMLVRAFMAGAILALAAAFAITITVQADQPDRGHALPGRVRDALSDGPDLLTGVFMLTPLALLDRRPGVTLNGILRNWDWVFLGNLARGLAFTGLTLYTTHIRTGPKREVLKRPVK